MNTQLANPDPLFDKQDAGDYLNEEPRTLDNKRSKGEGPDYVKLGRLVRYRKSDLDRYIASQTVRLKGNEAHAELPILNQTSFKARVATELHVSPEVAERHINNARRIFELAGG